MKISQNNIERNCNESEIYNDVLDLNDKRILELGCGTAEITRAIASNGRNRQITALEVDEQQHKKNLQLDELPNATFGLGGAEDIPVAAQSQDIIFMFKSLHHVPEDKLEQAMHEIHRTLTPGGMTYISEPVFMGSFNNIIRLFHDEEHVRQMAYDAIKKSINNGLFKLADEIFFNATVSFRDFSDFESQVLDVSHTNHQLDQKTYHEVKSKFEQHLTESGAHFTAPMRVDLLRKID
jgi:ubiquinone/menaquinone biosynthesis C-methylase UbiE